MKRLVGVVLLIFSTFVSAQEPASAVKADEAGVKMIPITTPKGTFKVWTKTVGENPAARVLLLHGGPGVTHEYLSIVAEKLAVAGFEAIEYDQLGSAFSDQPDESDLWEIDRFVDEVEQVRVALELDRDDFYLYGHSWGGILAIEYALRHQDHLKGLVISNMMSSIPAYNEYAKKVLMPAMDPKALAAILAMEEAHDTGNPRYEELLMEHFYTKHLVRRPPEEWPAEVIASFAKMNKDIYVPMQGPSEMGASGKLLHWDRSGDLGAIAVPTLVIGAAHDTMDPAHMKWMSTQFPDGRYLELPEGSHLSMHDDTERYFAGLIAFLGDVEGRVAKKEADRAPEIVSSKDPDYPEMAQRAHIQGDVVLEVTIDAEGNVSEVKVERGLPMGLAEAAVESVKTWVFKPAIRGGEAVEETLKVKVPFRLPKDGE